MWVVGCGLCVVCCVLCVCVVVGMSGGDTVNTPLLTRPRLRPLLIDYSYNYIVTDS